MKKAIFCLVNSEEQARRVVDRLLSSGFDNEDISILSPDQNRMMKVSERGEVESETVRAKPKKGTLTTEKHSKAPEGGVTGATAGGILGGSLGLLAGIGALAIPGVGPFIAAGPIMAALSGSAIGGSLGLLIGTLVGWGIPEFEAKNLEKGLKAGNILICVHSNTDQEINRANDIMKKEGARDICTTREKAMR